MGLTAMVAGINTGWHFGFTWFDRPNLGLALGGARFAVGGGVKNQARSFDCGVRSGPLLGGRNAAEV